jgi:hypothetical protein
VIASGIDQRETVADVLHDLVGQRDVDVELLMIELVHRVLRPGSGTGTGTGTGCRLAPMQYHGPAAAATFAKENEGIAQPASPTRSTA